LREIFRLTVRAAGTVGARPIIDHGAAAAGIDKFEISSISSSAFTSSEALIAGGALALCGVVAGLWLVRRRPT
jgi:hypothetical protein